MLQLIWLFWFVHIVITKPNLWHLTSFSRSAFFWFCNDERSKVKALNPEFGVGDIAKELGRRWSDVDPELKSKYEAMAEKDKARYDRVSWNQIVGGWKSQYENVQVARFIPGCSMHVTLRIWPC
jgi:hypothetical protein